MKGQDLEKLIEKAEKYVANDQYILAFECYSEILTHDYKNEDVLKKLIFLFSRIQEGNHDFEPQSAQEYLARGIARFYNEELEASIVDFDRSIELDKKNSYTYKCKAFSLKFLERYAEAMSVLMTAINLEKKGEYFDDMSEIYKAVGQIDDALECNRYAVHYTPDDARLLYNYGLNLAHADHVEAALIQFDKVLKIDPNYPEAHNCLMYCMQKIEEKGGL